MMMLRIAQFGSLFLTILAMAPAMAHLLELPSKIRLRERDYMTVQRVYRGWALAGFMVGAALLSTFALAALVYSNAMAFLFAVIAIVFTSATQAVFWAFTFPVNRQTRDWTELPRNWTGLRRQWEYSHATSAALSLTGLIALIMSVLAVG
jgi:hypothetical protein